MATITSSGSSTSGGGSLLGNMIASHQNSGSYSSATQQQSQQSPHQHQPKISSQSNANSASNSSILLLTPSSTSPPNTSTTGPVTPISQSQTGFNSSLGLGKGPPTSGANQIPGLVLSGMPASLSSMAGFLSGSTLTPYAQAAAAGALSGGLSGTNVSSTISSGVVTSVTANGSLGSTSLLGTGPGVLGLVSTQSSVEPLVLSSPVGGVLTSGSSVGVIGSNIGISGTGSALAMGSAGLPRPPSAPKQNGGTSRFRAHCF